MAKYARRKERDAAVLELNALAEEAGVDKIEYRAGSEAVADLYVRLCSASLPPPCIERLRSARARWTDNGGTGELDEGLLLQAGPDEESDGEEAVPGHHEVLARRGKPFRLRARAPLMILNIALVALTPVFI